MLQNDSGESMPEVHILDEHSGETGWLLWQLARDLQLLAGAPADDRPVLFTPAAQPLRYSLLSAAALDTPARCWLESILNALRPSATAEQGLLGRATMSVARWAAETGKPWTALAYGQAAADLEPDAGELALGIGALAARLGRNERAETWFERAVWVARRTGDFDAYGNALLGAARVREVRGDLSGASGRYRAALRAGRRHGAADVIATAATALMRIATRQGRYEEAERFRFIARRKARVESEVRREFERASLALFLRTDRLPAARTLVNRLRVEWTDPADQMLLHAQAAEVAAGFAAMDRLAEHWLTAWSLAQQHPDAPTIRETYLTLAYAAERAGDAVRMSRAAEAAARLQ